MLEGFIASVKVAVIVSFTGTLLSPLAGFVFVNMTDVLFCVVSTAWVLEAVEFAPAPFEIVELLQLVKLIKIIAIMIKMDIKTDFFIFPITENFIL
jgi:hypothetical protein